jgi:hypothetical protein
MIKLYLDENVPEAVAAALKLRGHDVLTTREADNKGLSDPEQLAYAVSKKRILFTFNVPDFVKLHSEFIKKGNSHSGIIVSKQHPVGTLVKAEHLLSRVDAARAQNSIIWLSDWIPK